MTKTIEKPTKSEKKAKAVTPKQVEKKVAKKASKAVKVSSAKKNPKALGLNLLVRNRPLSKNQKDLLKFIKRVKGVFTLKKAGEVIGHGESPYSAMYGFSAVNSLVRRGLVIKKENPKNSRKPIYQLVA